MNYKIEKGKGENEIYCKYIPKRINYRKKSFKGKKKDDNPFNVLSNVNFN